MLHLSLEASIRGVAPPTSSRKEFETEIESKSESEVLNVVVEKRKESKLRVCGGLRRRKRKREESFEEERHGKRESEREKKKKKLKKSNILLQ